MPQTKRPQQGPPEELPVLSRLLGYKKMLKQMQQVLSNKDLEEIGAKEIDTFRKDLNLVLKDLDNFRNKQDGARYFRSIDALRVNINDILTELAVARHLLLAIKNRELKMAEIADGVREFHRSLIRCQNYLEEAQKQFRI